MYMYGCTCTCMYLFILYVRTHTDTKRRQNRRVCDIEIFTCINVPVYIYALNYIVRTHTHRYGETQI